MSSALLKFQDAPPNALDPAILAAAIEVSPQALAITENGKVIFKNRSFAQLTSRASGQTAASAGLQTTDFVVVGRKFSLSTMHANSIACVGSDLQHLAIVGRLVAGVALDFNNLLTGILLYCDLLQSKADTAGGLSKKAE